MSNDEYGYGTGYTTSQNANVSFGDNPTPAAQPQAVKDISTAQFSAEVIQGSMQVPVLVDFWAPWCEPCKQLAPALEAAVTATNGKIRLVKMDIDRHPEVAGQMGIQSIPAVVAFVDGKPADAFMGVKTEGEIRDFIVKIAGPSDDEDQIETMLEEADKLNTEGDLEGAGQLYANILSVEPDNIKAIACIGHLYLAKGNLEATQSLLANLNEDQLDNPEIMSLKSAIDLAEQAAALGNTADDLQAKLDSDPNDPQLRLDLAIALNAANKREEAADHLLEIMKVKPGWNEDAARVQLLQFFEAWGMTDEVTISARRKLSSLLFS